MDFFPTRPASLLAVLGTAALMAAGCSKPLPPLAPAPPRGVSANSGGDTRGTVLYHPAPLPKKLPDPYADVSGKIVIGQRQRLAWELAEIDQHAHAQALQTYPVPDPILARLHQAEGGRSGLAAGTVQRLPVGEAPRPFL